MVADPLRKLESSERLLRMFIAHVPAAVAMFDRNMNYLAVSRRWIQDYRLEHTEVEGKNHYEIFPEIPERWREVHRSGLAGNIESSDADPFERADGRLDWVRWEVVPWRDEYGDVGGIVIFTEVITRHRELEHRLRQTEKMDALGTFVGEVAHEFNNSLALILGVCEMLLMRPDLHEEVRADLQQIRDATESSATLTSRLLSFARRQMLSPTDLGVDDTIRAILPLVERLRRDDIVLDVELGAGTSTIRADRDLLPTTLLNLVGNARDAMPGGGRISITTRTVGCDGQEPTGDAGDCVEICVTDTGDGMSEEVLRRACEPFFTTKERLEGNGLGLAAVLGNVEQHGGRFWLESSVGAGTRAVVRLPRVTASAAPDGGVEELPNPRRCILLVEDHDALRTVLRRSLERAGHRVIGASDAAAAEARWADLGPDVDLVVTDVRMPGVSGVDLVSRLRRQRPDLPVIFISGYHERELAQWCRGQNGVVVVHKPVAPAQLLRVIESMTLE